MATNKCKIKSKEEIRKKRFFAMVIDYFIICFICYIPVELIIGNELSQIDTKMNVYITCIMLLVIFKDIVFGNASIGKKLLKIEVVNEIGERPDNVIIILRNITLIVWPVELILFLVIDKRLGDILFKTKIANVNFRQKH